MSEFTKRLKARPTTYKGIEMRSRLEARFAGALDDLGIQWEYEPRAFASGQNQYLPDFKVWVEEEFVAYIEVKPHLGENNDAAGDILHAMRIIWDSEPDAMLCIATPELAPYLLALSTEPFPLWHLNRSDPQDSDVGRTVVTESTGFAAWFQYPGETPMLLPLSGIDEPFALTAMLEGAGPLPFDWRWRKKQ